MRFFEFAYYDYCFVLKYYDTLHTYNIRFRLSWRNSDHTFLSCIPTFCPFNNQFIFYNNFPTPICNEFIKGIKENQKEFDLYIKKIKFQTSAFLMGV